MDGAHSRAGTEEGREERLARDVREGLLSDPPTIPCACFYDDRGSRLFEEITRQPEYYQTRTEEALLERVAGDVVDDVRPDELVELGSGVGRKIRAVLDTLAARGGPSRCVLFDINERFLRDSVVRLAGEYPAVDVRGVHGDFRHDLHRLGPGGSRLVMLLAGTMGNLLPERLPDFLRSVALGLLPGDGFLVGVDTVKDVEVVEEDYNDRAGVTAAFNLNVLSALNRDLGADFDPAAWEHRAFYDVEHAWIEMRVRSRRDQRVRLPAIDLELDFAAGEEIRTEISAKYTRDSLARRLQGTGLALERWHTDAEERFALALLRRETDGPRA